MGAISIEHIDRLFWLGRYAERAFTTLKAIEKQYDSMIDENPHLYIQYLKHFGLEDIYGNMQNFIKSFLFDKNNVNSVAYSLERAYDNGIVLRDYISTDAFSFLQLGKDTLKKAEASSQGLLFALIPLEDQLFAFWGSINEYVYDNDIISILLFGKYTERLSLYCRMEYPFVRVQKEFQRLSTLLKQAFFNTPCRFNQKHMSALEEIMRTEEGYLINSYNTIKFLDNLFLKDK